MKSKPCVGGGDNSLEDMRPNSGSTASIAGGRTSSCSSAQNSDNDDDSDTKSTMSYKERRREAHTFAEQKRRDAIKRGYESLQRIVPTCQQVDSLGATKLSKATVLQRSIDYVQYLIQHKKKQEDELERLRKDVMALKIMKANYEHIVKTHQNSSAPGDSQLPEEIKFRVFQQVMDSLFHSFNQSISVSSFNELSACVFNWLEEYCKPQVLREITLASLHNATLEYR